MTTPPDNLPNNQSFTRRIEFIDLAKGLCIILVVAYHCNLGEYLPGSKCLRMPLYFLLSGLFFKDYGQSSILRKINKLIIPFIAFYILGDLYYWLAWKLYLLPASPKDYPIIDMIWGGTPSNMPIWFLECLFWCYVIFLFISRIVQSQWRRMILVMFVAAFGVMLSYIPTSFPTFWIDSACSALPFFYLGFILRRSSFLYPNKLDKFNLPLGIFLYVLSVLLLQISPRSIFSVYDNKFHGSVLLSYFISGLAVIAVLLICKQIKRLPFVSYIGKFSIIILCIHVPIMEVVYFVQRQFPYEPSSVIRWFVTLLISSALIPLFLRYFPQITAQRDFIKIKS